MSDWPDSTVGWLNPPRNDDPNAKATLAAREAVTEPEIMERSDKPLPCGARTCLSFDISTSKEKIGKKHTCIMIYCAKLSVTSGFN